MARKRKAGRRKRNVKRRALKYPLYNTRSRNPGTKSLLGAVKAEFLVSDPATTLFVSRNNSGNYTAVTAACTANWPANYLLLPNGPSGGGAAWAANHKPRGWNAIAAKYKYYRVESCLVIDDVTLSMRDWVPTAVAAAANSGAATSVMPAQPRLQANYQVTQRALKSENDIVSPGNDGHFRYYFQELPPAWSQTKVIGPGQTKRFVARWTRSKNMGREPQRYDKITSWEPLVDSTASNPLVPGSGTEPVAPRGPSYIPNGNSLQQGAMGDGMCYIWSRYQLLDADGAQTSQTYEVIVRRSVYYIVSFKDLVQQPLVADDLWLSTYHVVPSYTEDSVFPDPPPDS